MKTLEAEKVALDIALSGNEVERKYYASKQYYDAFQYVEADGAPHELYSVKQMLAAGRPILPAMKSGEIAWAGFGGIGVVPEKRLESWEISSTPPRAEISFGGCNIHYETNVKARIRSDCVKSMVIQTLGFEQCPYDSDKVEKNGDIKRFHCVLVAIPKS